MSKSIKALLALGLLASVAACAQAPQEEIIIVEPAPIVEEPVYSKYN
ncbi:MULTISPECIES: hypothetical protein [Paracoccaceae]|jgi:hypothetical protein|nr:MULTISPECIES: hypothetical protein [Paracoccaceae]MBO6603617.1 hypothetical protein [Roseicyclus sp.]MBO6623337.1 hypothetical protein [Roseicyclus sp.]MBO6922185.1 hypothetical protein [Roseicyclus sp.]